MLKTFLHRLRFVFLLLTAGVIILLFQNKFLPTTTTFPIPTSIIQPTITPSILPQATITTSPKPTNTSDYSSWNIETVCLPIQSWESAGFAPIIDLTDGTFIYRRTDGTLFRGTANRCKCLASSTNISTSLGEINVKLLKMGMLVWTVNKNKQKELQPILRLSTMEVGVNHHVSRMTLSDGRTLEVSPNHPTIDGQTAGQLKPGDTYDNAIVQSNQTIPYQDLKTYDLLPAGETGYYYANGIAMGSTLQ